MTTTAPPALYLGRYLTAWQLAHLAGYARPDALRQTLRRRAVPGAIRREVGAEGRAWLAAQGHPTADTVRAEWLLERRAVEALCEGAKAARRAELEAVLARWPAPPPAERREPPAAAPAGRPAPPLEGAPEPQWSITAHWSAPPEPALTARLIEGDGSPRLPLRRLPDEPAPARYEPPPAEAPTDPPLARVRQVLALCVEAQGAGLPPEVAEALQRASLAALPGAPQTTADRLQIADHWGVAAPEVEEEPSREGYPAGVPAARLARWRWSDRYLDAHREVIGRVFVRTAPLRLDCEQATDLLIQGELTFACRVRRPGYAERYPWNVTLSTTGPDCERDKLLSGRGAAFMVYAHASPGEAAAFARWFVVDLRQLALALRRPDIAPGLRHQHEPAREGRTGFWWVDLRTVPDGVVRACSHPEDLARAQAAHRARAHKAQAQEVEA